MKIKTLSVKFIIFEALFLFVICITIESRDAPETNHSKLIQNGGPLNYEDLRLANGSSPTQSNGTKSNIIKTPESPATTGSAVYTSNDNFTVPPNVHRVRVLVVGGGHGGGSGSTGGGGSGFVSIGELDVQPGEMIEIAVGSGGAGSEYIICSYYCAWIQKSKTGETSSFGNYLTADGGVSRPTSGDNHRLSGGSGGSGGGAPCGGSCTSGNGGSGGFDGFNGTTPDNGAYSPGKGQGGFAVKLRTMFRYNQLTPGEGGQGFSASNWGAGGGGAGGVLLNNRGPSSVGFGQNGAAGGRGYGAGGGGGKSMHYRVGNEEFVHSYAGGNGANGLVYVEW